MKKTTPQHIVIKLLKINDKNKFLQGLDLNTFVRGVWGKGYNFINDA